MSLSIIKTFILDLIFPRFCLGCGKEMASKQSALVCDACFGKIILNSGVQCHICGLRISKGTCLPTGDVPKGHKRCRRKTPLKRLLAAGQYKNPILKEMIHQFKYQSVESLKKPLAELVIGYLKKENLIDKFSAKSAESPLQPQSEASEFVLVPIPLTLKRKMNRGFNQSELLAEEIGKFLNCPVKNLLKRKKFAGPQAEISDWQKRKENISSAFVLSAKIPTEQFSDIKKIILIDDVATSGATLEEAARTLKEAGIKEIYGLVVAKG